MVNYTEAGQGDAIVLIHGFCESSKVWSSLSEQLAKNYRVLTVDLPGFGKSTLPDTSFSIDDIAVILWQWLDSIGIDQPVLIGHSLGGYVTLAMVNRQPQRPRGFCLFHSTARADSEEKQANRDKVIDFVKRHGVPPFIETFVPSLFFRKDHPAIPQVREMCLETTAEALTGYAAAMKKRPDLTAVLENSVQPVLLVAGEKDEVIPLESLMNQAVMPSNGRLLILPQTAHMGMFEAPERSVTGIGRFMQSIERG